MAQTRRDFFSAVGAGALAAQLAATENAAGQDTPKRNIVLFVTDDQSDAGCYGNPVVKTPSLDALAAEGTRFTHAFCTTPSCSPSRSVILTGRHNHANGMYGLAHATHHFASYDNEQTLPRLLKDGGYRTIHAGKFHVAPRVTYAFEEHLNFEFKDTKTSVDMADLVAPALSKSDDRPFFLYFCTREPHRDFQRVHADPIAPEAVTVPPFLPDTPECRQELAAYHMSCQEADLALGKVIEALKSSGHWEDTLFVWIADNGLPFPGAKTHLYDPGVRLPCVVRDPAAAARGVACDAMVSWCDITPTLLDYAGCTPSKHNFHGRPFLDCLGQEHGAGRDAVFFSHTFHEVTMYYPMRGYRDRRYKFIWNLAHELPFPFAQDLWASTTWQGVLSRGDRRYGLRDIEQFLHRPRYELYDLEQDPWEADNLAEQPEHRERLDGYVAKIRQFQEDTADPWAIKWRHE